MSKVDETQAIVRPAVSFERNVARLGEEMRPWLLPAYAPGVRFGKDHDRISDGKHTFGLGVSGRNARNITPEDTAGWIARERRASVKFNTLLRFPDHIDGLDGWELAALDIDAPQGHAAEQDGLKTLANFAEEKHLKPLPLETMVRNTNHGAVDLTGHFLIRVPSGMTMIPLAGVDWCDSMIRPIVFVGSAHRSGRIYRLFRGAEEIAGVPSLADWPELPDDWADALLRPRKGKVEETGAIWGPRENGPRDGERMCKAVRTLLKRWEDDPLNGESSRHGGMVRLAFALANFSAAGHSGAYMAAERLIDEFVSLVGENRREEAVNAVRGAWLKAGGIISGLPDPCEEPRCRRAPLPRVCRIGVGDIDAERVGRNGDETGERMDDDPESSSGKASVPDTFNTIRAHLIARGVNPWLAAAVAHSAVTGCRLFAVWCRMIHNHPTPADLRIDLTDRLTQLGFREEDARKAGTLLNSGQRVPDVFLFALASPDFHVPEGMLRR